MPCRIEAIVDGEVVLRYTRSDPPLCFLPSYGLRTKSSTWKSPLGRSVCCHWLLLCENCPHGPKLRAICKKALRCCSAACAVVCSRSDLSHVILQDLPHQWVFRHASAGHQDIHIPHPHTRLVSLPESTYIIAFFHLPHPSCCKFLPRLSRSGFGANPGHRNPDTSALFD